MKPIVNPTYRRIRRRIFSFKKLNLFDIEENELVDLIKSSFTIPTGLFPQIPGGKPIYRACINVDNEGNFIKEPFQSKSRIAFNPNPSKYGRCNLIGRPVFYGADGLEIAIKEVCNNNLNNSNSPIYLTVGEWKLTDKVEVSVVCHSKRAHRRSGDLIIAYHSLSRKMKAQLANPSKYRIWKLKNKFFSDEFAKNVEDEKEKNYLFSALYAHVALNTKQKGLQASGIWYPSVAYKLFGHNVAFKTELIENEILVLSIVKHVKCTFVSTHHKPQIEVIKESQIINNDTISW